MTPRGPVGGPPRAPSWQGRGAGAGAVCSRAPSFPAGRGGRGRGGGGRHSPRRRPPRGPWQHAGAVGPRRGLRSSPGPVGRSLLLRQVRPPGWAVAPAPSICGRPGGPRPRCGVPWLDACASHPCWPLRAPRHGLEGPLVPSVGYSQVQTQSPPLPSCAALGKSQPLCASVYSPVGWRVLQSFGRQREHRTGRDGRGLCWGVLGQRGPGLQGRPTGARGSSWSSGRQRGDRVQGGISKRQRSLG